MKYRNFLLAVLFVAGLSSHAFADSSSESENSSRGSVARKILLAPIVVPAGVIGYIAKVPAEYMQEVADVMTEACRSELCVASREIDPL